MKETKDAKTHVFRQEPIFLGEQQILSELTRPGMRVLDVGCAATGRSARLLKALGCDVYSIEINTKAISEFKRQANSNQIHLTAADMCSMPFEAGFFDLVLIAFHGVDYLLTKRARIRAFKEFGRISARDGVLIFNSLNRIGSVFSPSNFRSKDGLAWLVNHLLRLDFLKPTLIDINALELYQTVPGQIIRQVETVTDLRFSHAVNPKGNSRHLPLLTLFSTGPYYVFSR